MNVQEIKSDLSKLGLEDNIYLALLIYLAVSVRKTTGKISALVTGSTGTGKSFLVNTIMSLIPLINSARSSMIKHNKKRGDL